MPEWQPPSLSMGDEELFCLAGRIWRRVYGQYKIARNQQQRIRDQRQHRLWNAQNPDKIRFYSVRANIGLSSGIPAKFIPAEMVFAEIERRKVVREIKTK